MIIRALAEFYPVRQFTAGIERAARSVVRVSGSDNNISTGWLITETLVAVPDYLISQTSSKSSDLRFECRLAAEIDKSIVAHLIELPNTNSKLGERVNILQLESPLPDRVLSFGLEIPKPDDRVFLLHHPDGSPVLQLSIGRLLSVEGSKLRYDADTAPGSGGAPIFNARWEVIGMHFSSSQDWQNGQRVPYNQGLALSQLLKVAHSSRVWNEIARYHGFADTSAKSASSPRTVQASLSLAWLTEASLSSPNLLPSAVCWDFDPNLLTADEMSGLKPLVINPDAPRWTLRASERERLLRSAPSLVALQEARQQSDSTDTSDPRRQQVIDDILKGPPYDLNQIPESDLPYWLQAVHWFAGVIESLPTSVEVSRALERRRVDSRLQAISGPGFRGRNRELKTLQNWYEDEHSGPMVVTGVGGLGKSALIARFADSLPANRLLLWLDFDRADLAPDDAQSVLHVLGEQAAVQLEGFVAPEFGTSSVDSWEREAEAFGSELARTINKPPPPLLLVLDGFEIAQHVKKHDEIWHLLELVLDRVPTLRVLVSGRAPVSNLKLRGRPTSSLPLEGMDRLDAEAWLRDRDITDPAMLNAVLDMSHGIPLRLKLAARWIEAGGTLNELATNLPQALIEGYLYQRILDRVVDPLLKPVARDALILRRISPEMLPEVLGANLPEGLDPSDVFGRLAQEMSLFESNSGNVGEPLVGVTAMGGSLLQLRPEVRSATLRLLEIDDRSSVRQIDQRAVAWYRKQPSSDIANVVELVYHLLRLNDVAGAAQVWNDDCAPLLLYAENDLPENASAAGTWLRHHIEGVTTAAGGLKAWELDAAQRIRSALHRELYRAIPQVLAERAERSEASPLILYDAWLHWRNKDVSAARKLLKEAGEPSGTVGRDRAILAALLAAQESDRREADRLLASVERPELWHDRPNGDLELLAIRAARIRLTVDLDAELELSQVLEGGVSNSLIRVVKRYLVPSDVQLERLSQKITGGTIFESTGRMISVPFEASELIEFAKEMDQVRHERLDRSSRFVSHLILPPLGLLDLSVDEASLPWTPDDLQGAPLSELNSEIGNRAIQLAITCAILGWRRWYLATTGLFLSESWYETVKVRQATSNDRVLSLSIIATLCLYREHSAENYFLMFGGDSTWYDVDSAVQAVWSGPSESLNPERVSVAARILNYEAEGSFDQGPWVDNLQRLREQLHRQLSRRQGSGFVCYLLGADPLGVLVQRIIGAPEISIPQ